MAGGSYVGLDIGSNLMKVVEVRRTGKGLEVTAIGLAETPADAYENSVIVDVAAMSKAVKELLKTAGITTKQCVSSVSGQSAVVVRVIEVPKMNPAELEETMKYEVERHVPFNNAGVITDYVPIDRPEGVPDGGNMEILLAAAQQDIIDRHCEMLFAAGLKPVAIDVEPLAVGRTLLDMSAGEAMQPGYTVAIVNMGASITDVGIYRDKLLSFSRTIPLGGDTFTRAIADNMQVDLVTADKYKREYGEIVMDQQGGQQPYFTGNTGGSGFGGGGGGGFMDFSMENQPPVPNVTTDASPSGRTPFDVSAPANTVATSSPSGRMPFDFSTPSQGPSEPGLGGFESPAQPAPLQNDHGFGAPVGQVPEPSFYNPGAPIDPVTPPNLPVPVSPGGTDPAHDALRYQVFGAISQSLVDISQELKRSLDYYRSRTGDAPIHEILLVGGSAKLKGLAAYLQSECGIPARVANPMENVQVTAKSFSAQRLEEVSTLFPVSIGLGAYYMVGGPVKGKKRK